MINNKFIVSWIPYIYPQFGDVKYIQWCHAVGAHRIKPIESTNTLPLNSFAAKDVHLDHLVHSLFSRRHVYITPTSYLELLSSFISVLAMKRKQAWKDPVVIPMSEFSMSILRVFAGLGAWPNLPCYVMWHMTLRFWYLKYLDVIEQLEWLWQW